VEAPGVPLSLAWEMWQNKSEIPTWMPWITSVTARAARTCMRLSVCATVATQRNAPDFARARPRCRPARGAQVQPEDARMSKWSLSTVQFGQTLELAWLARDLTPVQNQKARRASAHHAEHATPQLAGAH
jgi:hypothetical protein